MQKRDFHDADFLRPSNSNIWTMKFSVIWKEIEARGFKEYDAKISIYKVRTIPKKSIQLFVPYNVITGKAFVPMSKICLPKIISGT